VKTDRRAPNNSALSDGRCVALAQPFPIGIFLGLYSFWVLGHDDTKHAFLEVGLDAMAFYR
jgi:hypothetical protein